MDQTSTREKDNIELSLFFMLRHWRLLAILSVIGAAIGLGVTLNNPSTYSAALSIPAPTYTMPEFDRLMLSAPGNPHADRLSHTASGRDRDVVKASVSKMLADVSATANVALEREKQRLAELLRVRAVITDEAYANTANPVELANALATNLNAVDLTEHRISTIERWRDQFPVDVSVIETTSGHGIYLGLFSGFTLALVISLIRSYLLRAKVD